MKGSLVTKLSCADEIMGSVDHYNMLALALNVFRSAAIAVYFSLGTESLRTFQQSWLTAQDAW